MRDDHWDRSIFLAANEAGIRNSLSMAQSIEMPTLHVERHNFAVMFLRDGHEGSLWSWLAILNMESYPVLGMSKVLESSLAKLSSLYQLKRTMTMHLSSKNWKM